MTFAKFFSIRSLTFNLILHILQSCIYYVKKQFHNFLTLFDTTIPKYKQFQTFPTYTLNLIFPTPLNPGIKSYYIAIIKQIAKQIASQKKKHTRTYTKNTNEKKSLHFVRRLTSSSSCRERKQGEKRAREEDEQVTRFTVGRANGPVIFHDALTSPLLSFLSATRFATRSSETKVENQSPRSSTHFNHELRGRDHASDYVQSR